MAITYIHFAEIHYPYNILCCLYISYINCVIQSHFIKLLLLNSIRYVMLTKKLFVCFTGRLLFLASLIYYCKGACYSNF